ncbi:YqaA family protein [Mesorhizobium sp. Z1-4]|uniref:YqaA family protein n=1 Tax=Mesorhizobium sp. Z1-4 TaxID=2448478 RepID=UPI000FD90EBC|nr:YqaA family protein [Mesorhizobium sp. Z1-4]
MPILRWVRNVAETVRKVENLTALAALFGIAFAAATFIPAQSEAALVGMQIAGYPVVLLIAVASLGNTLGAVVNWALGCGMQRFSGRRWFPVSPTSLDRASAWYRRWGRWSLLLSWAPIGGDALTVAAGVLREPFWSFLALVAIAKTGRYVILSAVTVGLIG